MARPVEPASFLAQPLDSVLGHAASVRLLRVFIRHGGALPAGPRRGE